MPPFLASGLMLAFILWLFYRNAKGGHRASMGVWVATIWVGILASRPIGYWLGAGAGSGQAASVEEGSPIDRAILFVLIISALFVLMRRGIDWGGAMRSNRWLWLFYFYLLVSVLWSEYPFVAFKRWFREFGSLAMILVILTEEDPIAALRSVFVFCGYVLIPLSILTSKYYLETGRYYNQWTGAACICGVTCDKNALGRLAMVSGLFLLWSLVELQKSGGWLKTVRKGLPEVLVLSMCVWTLCIAGSATALGCAIAGVGVFAASRTRWLRTNPRFAARCGLVFIVVSMLCLALDGLRKVITGGLGRNPNLTERTDVWAACMGSGTNPLIGEGFGSFWLTRKGQNVMEELNVGEAHNGYLQTYLNSGLIGVGLLLAVLARAGKSVMRQLSSGSVLGSLYAALFLSGFIFNYTEAAFDGSVVGFVLFLIATQYRAPDELWAGKGGQVVDENPQNAAEPEHEGLRV
jgi:exopolysaccharide production protein ExoQ